MPFKIKKVTEKVTRTIITDLYTTSRINQLIREDAQKQSMSATKIVWNANNTATVEAYPSTQKKKQELLKESEESEKQKSQNSKSKDSGDKK